MKENAIKTIAMGLTTCTLAFLFSGARLHAQSIFEDTHLVDVRLGSTHSQMVKDQSRGGYELSDGTPVNFSNWYTSKWPDLSIRLLTEVNDDIGFLWGLSTGERGPKYRIEPSLRVGFIFQNSPTKNALVSLSITTVLGGNLTEKACIADYGFIGGIQTVNCRLAASTLPPAETLQYLWDLPPAERVEVNFQYTLVF